ncbi:MAG: type II toxin-antitoxin system YhaV family toxin [Desulfotignum sp.]|nr:type II toxin-antitoxin system YhaV family toxin [Desulfobacteraceae bacterium]
MCSQWKVLYFTIFYEQYNELVMEVSALRKKDPDTYKTHPKTKFLAKIRHVIWQRIVLNPKSKEFHLGDTFPEQYRCYKRAKSGLPNRYRLFFRYKSKDGKIVILWMNSDKTLRSQSSKSDPYTVFLKMLKSKKIPPNWKQLVSKSTDIKTKRAKKN